MRPISPFYIILFLGGMFLFPAYGQEQLGLKLDNYSGINSALLNPASPATCSFRWDVNLLAIAGFFDNNYAYFEDASIFDFRTVEEFQSRPEIKQEGQFSTNTMILDYYDGNQKKWASGSTTITGPSLTVNLASGWSFGAFTQIRVSGQFRKLPTTLDYYQYNAAPRFRTIDVDQFKGTAMAWSELGLNVSKSTPTNYGKMALGANVKILNGHEAAFGIFHSQFQITKNNNDKISLQNIESDFGFTTSNADILSNGDILSAGSDINLAINGHGFATDLGVQFIIEGYPDKYQWKLGAAILDIGRINFNKNAQSHQLNSSQSFQLATTKYESITNPEEATKLLSFDAFNDSTATFQENTFHVWLPAALSLQADYAISNNMYASATLIQRIPIGTQALVRDNVFALTPRYENRWFGAMMPLSLLNYQQVHLGFAARLAFITIGTDNLGSFLQQREFTGSDFYIALKLNPFELNESFGGNGKRKGNVKCYDF